MPKFALRKPKVILDLGAGPDSRLRPSYPDSWVITADIDPETKPDVVCDVAALPFADESIDWAYASHILEHFHWGDTPKVLAEWVRVIGMNGVLRVVVPDLTFIAQSILDKPMTPALEAFIYGSHANDFQVHKAGFTVGLLAAMAQNASLVVLEADTEDFHMMLTRTFAHETRQEIEKMRQVYVVGVKRKEN